MEDKIVYEVNVKPDGGWEICRPISYRLKNFTDDRLLNITQGKTPVKLEDGPKIIIHFITQSTLDAPVDIDVRQFANGANTLSPLGTLSCNARLNASGIVTYAPSSSEGSSSAYLQLFRDGVVETVSTRFFTYNANRTCLMSLFFEQQVLSAVSRFTTIAKQFNMVGPHWVAISFLGAKGCFMGVDTSRILFDVGSPIDDDVVLVPYARIEGDDIGRAMRPSFDFVWQAAGWPGSHYYDADGDRTSR